MYFILLFSYSETKWNLSQKMKESNIDLVQSKSFIVLTKLIWKPLIQERFLALFYNGQFVHDILKYPMTHIHPLYL